MDDELSRRLRQVPEFEVGVTIPQVLSNRLDALVATCDAADVPTRRKEVVAALLLAAPQEADALEQVLHDYRHASLDDALVEGTPLSALVPGQRGRPRARRKSDSVPEGAGLGV